MDSSGKPESSHDPAEPLLVDVTGMSLRDLTSSRNTVLDNAVRRLLEDLDQPREIVSAFGNVP
jgi:FXSXX-COOH protein